MKKYILTLLGIAIIGIAKAQVIPLDTTRWEINANAYVLENYKGKDAIYLQSGSITLKDLQFLNGTIEYDLYVKDERGFPGIYFRAQENGDAEHFYIRPHQSGNPDATQAIPTTKNITAWQLYHGPKYSFPYEFTYDEWLHVKIKVNENQAQVFLGWDDKPNLSWNTFHDAKAGKIILSGGNGHGLHIANINVSEEAPEIADFNPKENKTIDGVIEEWQVSDKFSEKKLEKVKDLSTVTQDLEWVGGIEVEEGVAANISRIHDRFDGSNDNTVLAKLTINSTSDQLKFFEFGYSDRVVAFLNGTPIYKGNNRFRSRDYRYLGTIGLFDGIFLDLKKGKNELVMAVSEDFGGWLITGKFADESGLKIK